MADFSWRFPNLGLEWHCHTGGGRIWDRTLARRSRAERKALIDASRFPQRAHNRVFINKRIANLTHLTEIASTFPGVRAIHIRRDPVDTVMSLLHMRQQKYRSRSARWGFIPPDMPSSVPNPIEDCVWQYRKIRELIDDAMPMFCAAIVIDYHTFCRNTSGTLTELNTFLGLATCSHNNAQAVRERTSNRPREVVVATRAILAESRLPELRQYASNLVTTDPSTSASTLAEGRHVFP